MHSKKNRTENYIIQCSDMTRRPDIRELTKINGMSYPSDEELVMLILGKGVKGNPIENLSMEVMNVVNSSTGENLLKNLIAVNGMGETRALAVAAALELGKRRNTCLNAIIEKPQDVIPYVKHYTLKQTEHFVTITLNGARQLLSVRLVSVGTLNKAVIHPREVLAEPVMEHASAIICCHNHPGGICYPSQADIKSTEILEEAASVLGISFVDHLILSENDYFSFLEHGMLKRMQLYEAIE